MPLWVDADQLPRAAGLDDDRADVLGDDVLELAADPDALPRRGSPLVASTFPLDARDESRQRRRAPGFLPHPAERPEDQWDGDRREQL